MRSVLTLTSVILFFTLCSQSYGYTHNISFLASTRFGSEGKRYAGAFFVALDDVRAKLATRNVSLGYYFTDTRKDTLRVIRGMTRDYFNKTIAFIGPDYKCSVEATVAGAWEKPMVAYKCLQIMSFSKLHPTFASTQPSLSKVSQSIVALMRFYKWKSYTAIVGRSFPNETFDYLRTLSGENDIGVNDVVYFEEPYYPNARMPGIIERTFKNTRIYVFLGDYHALIDFVRGLQTKGLTDTGEYAVISMEDRNTKMEDKKHAHFKRMFEEEGSMMKKFEAFRSVLLLSPRMPTNDTAWDNFQKSVMEQNYKPPIKFIRIPPKYENKSKARMPINAAYIYDAVTIIARAITDVIDEDGDINNGMLLYKKMLNRSYHSIMGYEMYLDGHGSAEENYTVLTLHKKGDNYTMTPCGNFWRVDNTSDHKTFHLTSSVWWPSGQPPLSEPPCGFDGEKCGETDWKIPTICAATALAFICLGFFFVRYYLYEKKLEMLLWKIDKKDLFAESTDGVTAPRRPKVTFKLRRSRKYIFLGDSDDDSLTKDKELDKQTKVTTCTYKGSIVAIKHVVKKNFEIDRKMKQHLQLRKEMHHENINTFIGACVETPNIYIVSQYNSRQSLEDVLMNADINLDEMFISSLIADLLKGMIYLHDSEFCYHGNLKSSNCLVDNRWVLKISDFGLHPLSQCDSQKVQDERYLKRLLWHAPERLQFRFYNNNASPKVDVYAFGIILYEAMGRHGPWGRTDLTVTEIIQNVKNCDGEPFRPDTSALKCDDIWTSCMKWCWVEDPDLRPDFKTILKLKLKTLYQGRKSNIVDNMLSMMEKYANNLESLVDERTEQLQEEKKLTENLLLRMLPRSVADQLKLGKPVIPESYDCVTIYFSDIVGFTSLSAGSTPMEIVDMLNDLYTCFDSTIEHYDVYKVETIGDAYMVVSGLPLRNRDNHAGEVASMSLRLLDKISCFKIRHRPNETLKLRIGIHSGPCVAAVVGLKMPRYCLFGDTVNTSSRMESTGLPLKIHCSGECKNILDSLGGYNLEERGIVNMKGKGNKLTFFLNGEDQNHRLKRLDDQSANHVDKSIKRLSSCSSCIMQRDATSLTMCYDDDVSISSQGRNAWNRHSDRCCAAQGCSPTNRYTDRGCGLRGGCSESLFEMKYLTPQQYSDNNVKHLEEVSNTSHPVDPHHSNATELDSLLKVPDPSGVPFVNVV